MGMFDRARRQKATYWEPDTTNELGETTFKTSVTVRVRFEEKTEQFLDSEGAPQLASAIVYANRNDSTLKIGGFLMLGTLTTTTTVHADATEIAAKRNVPTMKANEGELRLLLK